MIDICSSAELVDGATGVRFEVQVAGKPVPAFAIRFAGVARAYLNRCAHVAMELDWQPGQFFDAESAHLVCSTHGAHYDPADGRCAGGPCAGRGGLRALSVVERDGRVGWLPDGYAQALPGAA